MLTAVRGLIRLVLAVLGSSFKIVRFWDAGFPAFLAVDEGFWDFGMDNVSNSRDPEEKRYKLVQEQAGRTKAEDKP